MDYNNDQTIKIAILRGIIFPLLLMLTVLYANCSYPRYCMQENTMQNLNIGDISLVYRPAIGLLDQYQIFPEILSLFRSADSMGFSRQPLCACV